MVVLLQSVGNTPEVSQKVLRRFAPARALFDNLHSTGTIMHRIPTWILITGTLAMFVLEVIAMLWLLLENT